MIIENPTLVHFRHFRHFSSLLTNLPFTLVVSALQIRPFMQNKANFRKSQMNVNKVITRAYEHKDTWWSGKNEPKTNPIYPCVASGEAGTNPIYPCVASGEAGSNPISPPQTAIFTQFHINELRTMNNELIKTNPIQTQTKPI